MTSLWMACLAMPVLAPGQAMGPEDCQAREEVRDEALHIVEPAND